MKINILLFFGMLLGIEYNSLAQKDQGFVIMCKFKGLANGTKVYLTTQERDTVSKAISKGDQFVFHGKLPLDGRFHFIWMDTLVTKAFAGPIFVVNNGMKIFGTVGEQQVKVEGSPAHKDYNEFMAMTEPYKLRIKEIYAQEQQFGIAFGAGKSNTWWRDDSLAIKEYEQQIKNYRSKLDSVYKERNQAVKNWLMNHKGSLMAPWFIRGYAEVAPDLMQQAFDALDREAKAGYYGQKALVVLEQAINATKIKEGNIIPDFFITDMDGKKISIKDIASKNKYTLIDIWASWCKPCREAIPGLRDLYLAYKGKGFNIVGLSQDRNISQWKKAVREDGTVWMQGLDTDKITLNVFGIQAIPSYILIDSKGKLIAFDGRARIKSFGGSLRNKEEFQNRLAKLLND